MTVTTSSPVYAEAVTIERNVTVDPPLYPVKSTTRHYKHYYCGHYTCAAGLLSCLVLGPIGLLMCCCPLDQADVYVDDRVTKYTGVVEQVD